MEVGKLTVQLRKDTGKGVARKLRNQGLVPGVCYGEKLENPLPITLNPKSLRACLHPEKRNNTVITVTVENGGTNNQTLVAMIKDYQVHPLRRDVTHVDLIAIDPDKEVDSEVPITLVGKPKGAIEGGQTHVVRREATVRAKPADIPAKLVLDISGLDIGDALHISDIEFPAGVKSVDSLGLAVVTMTAPEKEEAPAAEAEAAPAAAAAAPAKKEEKKD